MRHAASYRAMSVSPLPIAPGGKGNRSSFLCCISLAEATSSTYWFSKSRQFKT